MTLNAVKPGLCRGYWAEPIGTQTVRCAPISHVTRCKPHPTTWIADFFIDFCVKPKKCEKRKKRANTTCELQLHRKDSS